MINLGPQAGSQSLTYWWSLLRRTRAANRTTATAMFPVAATIMPWTTGDAPTSASSGPIPTRKGSKKDARDQELKHRWKKKTQ